MAQAQRSRAESNRTVTAANSNTRPAVTNVRVIRSDNINNTLPASMNPTGRRSTTPSQYTDAPDNQNLYQTADKRFREENYNRPNSILANANDNKAPESENEQQSGTRNAEAEYSQREQQVKKQTIAKQAIMQQKLEAQKAAEAEAESNISVPGLPSRKHMTRAEGLKASTKAISALSDVWLFVLLPAGLLNIFAAGLLQTMPTFIESTIENFNEVFGMSIPDAQIFYSISFVVQLSTELIVLIVAATMLKLKGVHPLNGKQGVGWKQTAFILTIATCLWPGGAILPIFMVWILVAGLNPN